MKFACDSCQTKYTIPDEKVRGKVLKIRCKKCGSVITVKEEAPAPEPEIEAPPPEERTRVADIGLLEKLRMTEGKSTNATMRAAPAYEPPQPEATEAPTNVKPAVFHEWYAMIGGQQSGPFNHSELEARVQSGEVTERSHVWRDGLGDWQRAAEVDDLKSFFAAPPPPPPPPAPPPPPPRAAAVPAPMMPASFDPEELPTRLGPRPDLSTLGDAGFFDQEGQGEPQVGGAMGEEPGPSPNLADLVASDLEQHAAEAGSLGSGPVEMGPAPGSQPDPFAGVSDAPGIKSPVIGEQTRFFMKKAGVTNRNPWWKYALFVVVFAGFGASVVFALGQAGVGGTVAIMDASGEVKQVKFFSVEGIAANTGLGKLLLGKTKATAEAIARAQKPPVKAPKPVTPTTRPDDTPDRAAPKANLTPEEQKKLDAAKAIANDAANNPFAPIAPDPTKGNGPKSRPKEEKPVAAVDGAGSLTQEQINKVVGDTAPAFNKCVEEYLRHNPDWKGGKVVISLIIKSSGVVTAPTIDKKDVDDLSVGECIRSKAKRMIFPRFEGEEQPVEFPLILTNGG